MKKWLSIVFLASLLFITLPIVSKAMEIEPTVEGSEVLMTEEQESSVDVNSLPNVANSVFTPGTTGEMQTFGLKFARGTIGCFTVGSNVYCPWTIEVGGDVIVQSKVIVYLEKDYGFLNGGWKNYSTFSFNYPVNIPTSTISNEASFRLSKGAYRAKLGGSFITAKNGVYSAIANGASYFEIK
ncbi:hypothetical protein [Rummeliibacillus sp. SL167]|uniref:hypothetical protein n=1 Tax=Rummeliibacillus sp. SL167 TaxID=2579792 RepID=UPI0011B5DE3D|nr:hypothetical protein [Rummeliibacillus sp. SL167]